MERDRSRPAWESPAARCSAAATTAARRLGALPGWSGVHSRIDRPEPSRHPRGHHVESAGAGRRKPVGVLEEVAAVKREPMGIGLRPHHPKVLAEVEPQRMLGEIGGAWPTKVSHLTTGDAPLSASAPFVHWPPPGWARRGGQGPAAAGHGPSSSPSAGPTQGRRPATEISLPLPAAYIVLLSKQRASHLRVQSYRWNVPPSVGVPVGSDDPLVLAREVLHHVQGIEFANRRAEISARLALDPSEEVELSKSFGSDHPVA